MAENQPHIVEPRTARFMLIQAFSRAVGYSEKAVYRKIEDGVWKEGREYLRAPDGRLLIDLVGFERWLQQP